jgi:aspartate racemase
MRTKQRIVGILGGKGPEATHLLFERIIKNTPANVEEDHLRIIIDNNPKIPKPALGITGEGNDPVPALVDTAKNLERARADLIVIACNSAHYYLNEIRSAVGIPVVSIITETVSYVQDFSHMKVGLLATTGLINSKLYQEAFQNAGISVLSPAEEQQDELLSGIMDFKDSGVTEGLRATINQLCVSYASRGAEALVVACTDIPVAVDLDELPLPCFDTLEILALAAVREASR